MIENLAEVGSCLRHRFAPALAQADSMALSRAFENYIVAVFPQGEIIAWHCVPAALTINRQPGTFSAFL